VLVEEQTFRDRTFDRRTIRASDGSAMIGRPLRRLTLVIPKLIGGSSMVNRGSGSEVARTAKRTISAVAVLGGYWHLAAARHLNLRRLSKQRWRRPSYISISTRASRSSRGCIDAPPPTNRSATPTTMVRPNVSELDRRAASSSRAGSPTSGAQWSIPTTCKRE